MTLKIFGIWHIFCWDLCSFSCEIQVSLRGWMWLTSRLNYLKMHQKWQLNLLQWIMHLSFRNLPRAKKERKITMLYKGTILTFLTCICVCCFDHHKGQVLEFDCWKYIWMQIQKVKSEKTWWWLITLNPFDGWHFIFTHGCSFRLRIQELYIKLNLSSQM